MKSTSEDTYQPREYKPPYILFWRTCDGTPVIHPAYRMNSYGDISRR